MAIRRVWVRSVAGALASALVSALAGGCATSSAVERSVPAGVSGAAADGETDRVVTDGATADAAGPVDVGDAHNCYRDEIDHALYACFSGGVEGADLALYVSDIMTCAKRTVLLPPATLVAKVVLASGDAGNEAPGDVVTFAGASEEMVACLADNATRWSFAAVPAALRPTASTTVIRLRRKD